MAKIKIKSLYEQFQEDYVAVKVLCANKDGFRVDYVYYASWFIWNLPQEKLKKQKN